MINFILFQFWYQIFESDLLNGINPSKFNKIPKMVLLWDLIFLKKSQYVNDRVDLLTIQWSCCDVWQKIDNWKTFYLFLKEKKYMTVNGFLTHFKIQACLRKCKHTWLSTLRGNNFRCFEKNMRWNFNFKISGHFLMQFDEYKLYDFSIINLWFLFLNSRFLNHELPFQHDHFSS